MASTSGRGLECLQSGPSALRFCRSTVILPKQHGLVRVAYRQRNMSCEAVALRDWAAWPLFKSISNLFKSSQEERFGEKSVLSSDKALDPPRRDIAQIVKEKSVVVLQIGLRLTGIAFNLASRVVSDLRHGLVTMKQEHDIQKQKAVEAQKIIDAETKLQYELQRQRLQLQGKDVAFVKMLHVLDRCHLDHDAKWALVQKHTADKAEFSERLQHLFNLAQASKEAVDTLLRPDASRKEINTFWKSAQTMAVIAEEDKLKQLVFAQMLQASS